MEHRLVDREPDRGLVVRGGDEDGAIGHEREPARRRVVDVREEEEMVRVAADAPEVLEEVRRVRTLRVEERALVLERVRRRERAVLVSLK